MIKSLRIVRPKHTQEIIDREYGKLDDIKLVMWSGGMTAFFGRLTKQKLALKKMGEVVSDAYLLRRTKMAITGSHKTLTDALVEMRKIIGVSGVPTTRLLRSRTERTKVCSTVLLMLTVNQIQMSARQRERHEHKNKRNNNTPGVRQIISICNTLRRIISYIHYTLNVGFLTPPHFKVYVNICFYVYISYYKFWVIYNSL